MFLCQIIWSGKSTDIRNKKRHRNKKDLANFCHIFAMLCLLKSQRSWSTAEHTKGRGQTSLTTTKIQGGCTTIYNLPCLLCDSRGGCREGGETRHTEKRLAYEFQSRGKTIVLFLFFCSLDWGPPGSAPWVKRQ